MKPSCMKPMLITMSGAKGAGKTTQAERLAAKLRDNGARARKVTFVRLNLATWIHYVRGWLTSLRSAHRRHAPATTDRTAGHDSANGHNGRGEQRESRDHPPVTPQAGVFTRWTRNLLYLGDVLLFRVYLLVAMLRRDRVLVLDRWFLDVQARLLRRGVTVWRVSRWLTPATRLSFVLLVKEDDSVTRRAWIDPASLRNELESYDLLPWRVPNVVMIPAADEQTVSRHLDAQVNAMLGDRPAIAARSKQHQMAAVTSN